MQHFQDKSASRSQDGVPLGTGPPKPIRQLASTDSVYGFQPQDSVKTSKEVICPSQHQDADQIVPDSEEERDDDDDEKDDGSGYGSYDEGEGGGDRGVDEEEDDIYALSQDLGIEFDLDEDEDALDEMELDPLANEDLGGDVLRGQFLL